MLMTKAIKKKEHWFLLVLLQSKWKMLTH